MKSVIIVVALCLAFALSQTIPASTNPTGTSYFSNQVVGTLTLNQTSSSTIYNTTGYQNFWKIWIPNYVGAVRYTITNNATDVSYIYATINFEGSYQDDTVGFSCDDTGADEGSICYNYDAYLEAYYSDYEYEEYYAYDSFQPGQWQYITVGSDIAYYNVPYGILVESVWECPNTSVIALGDDTYSCRANSAITNVTSNGATYSGNFATASQVDVYRVDVPQNVSRVWAWVSAATAEDWQILVSESAVSLDDYYAYDEDTYGSSLTSGGYSYELELALPSYNTPVFFTLLSYGGVDTGAYNITFYWSACGSSSAGYGEIDNNFATAVSTFYVPDCSDPVSLTNYNPLTSLATVNFAIPAYNSSADNEYAGVYGFINIPAGTVGSLNITCNSTVSDTFLILTKNGPSDCYGGYAFSISCSGGGYTYDEYFWLLSEELYPGGYWSIGACSEDASASTVSIVSTGSVAAGASASPSPGSDNGSSSSDSSTVLPALLLVVLAAMFAF